MLAISSFALGVKVDPTSADIVDSIIEQNLKWTNAANIDILAWDQSNPEYSNLWSGGGGLLYAYRDCDVVTDTVTGVKSIEATVSKTASIEQKEVALCCDGCDFPAGTDFSGLDISKTSLSNSELVGANFQGANLLLTPFVGSNLAGSDFTGAENLNGGRFKGSNLFATKMPNQDLTGTDFDGVTAAYGDYSGATMVGTVLTDSSFPYVTFDKALISRLNLEGINMFKASFKDATLAEIGGFTDTNGGFNDFTRAIFKGITFTDTNFPESTFTNATFQMVTFEDIRGQGGVFTGAKFLKVFGASVGVTFKDTDFQRVNFENGVFTDMYSEDTRWYEAILNNVLFIGGNVADAKFSGAKMRGVEFRSTYLEAVFSAAKDVKVGDVQYGPADLVGAKFTQGARLSKSDFAGVDLSGAVFDGVTMTGTDFTGAIAIGATFDGSNAMEANFNNALMKGASFVGTNLNKATFVGTDLTNADFTGAILPFGGPSGQAFAGAKGLLTATFDAGITVDPKCSFCCQAYDNLVFYGKNKNSPSPNLMDCTDFTGKDFSNLDLSGLKLMNLEMSKTNFDGSTLGSVEIINTNLDQASFENTHLVGTKILTGTKMTNGYFKGSKWSKATVMNSDLSGGDFRLSSWDAMGSSTFNTVTLIGTEWSNVDLTGQIIGYSDFFDAKFGGATFTNAILAYSDLSCADASGAQFEGANIEFASFREANIDRALFYDSIGFDKAWFAGATGMALYDGTQCRLASSTCIDPTKGTPRECPPRVPRGIF